MRDDHPAAHMDPGLFWGNVLRSLRRSSGSADDIQQRLTPFILYDR